MAIEGNCDVHDWSWDPIDDYGCPVCYGMSIERERILDLLEDWVTDDYGDFNKVLAFIKGENE